MWNEVCSAEKDIVKSDGVARKHFRQIFKNKRTIFDREVQRCKKKYVTDQQKEIENLVYKDQQNVYKKIGKIGIGQERLKKMQTEILLEDGLVTNDTDAVKDKWKTNFCNLLNPNKTPNDNEEIMLCDIEDSNINQDINSMIRDDEVIKAVKEINNNKASDEIPAEIRKNKTLTKVFGVLFNKCFDHGIVSDVLKLGVITLIPKSSTSNNKDRLSYRGITLAPVTYKIYCSILNSKLSLWEDDNNILHDGHWVVTGCSCSFM